MVTVCNLASFISLRRTCQISLKTTLIFAQQKNIKPKHLKPILQAQKTNSNMKVKVMQRNKGGGGRELKYRVIYCTNARTFVDISSDEKKTIMRCR